MGWAWRLRRRILFIAAVTEKRTVLLAESGRHGRFSAEIAQLGRLDLGFGR